jgi:hypothetical protein
MWTVIANGRPSSTFPPISRPQSYYATYPIATPKYGYQCPFPVQYIGGQTPNKKPSLTPINTAAPGLRRDDSSSSGENPILMTTSHPPRHKSSVDRLRNAATANSSRAPSPVSEAEGSSSLRSNSPHPSSQAFPNHRPNISSSLTPTALAGYPRAYSTHSLASSRQLYAPQGNAPHQKQMQLEMPKLLGARPDSSGDFFWGQGRPQEGFSLGFDPHRRQTSRGESGFLPVQRGNADVVWIDFYPDGSQTHTRYSSSQSMPGRVHPEVMEAPPADPRMVLNRKG